jgi:malic enzyme
VSIWYLVRGEPLLVQGEADAARLDIAARVDGRVAVIPVERGQNVAAGAVLVTIDNLETVAKNEQAYTLSKGKAIYAAGVQFAPVHYDGQTCLPGQGNNLYIFPPVGMAIFVTQAKQVSDEMFIEAAQAVADQVPPELLKQGILEVDIQTAARVAKLIFESGLARVGRPADMMGSSVRQAGV